MRVCCQQLAPRVGALQENLAVSVDAVRDGFARGADLVVLPELVTSGYVFVSREEAGSAAIASDHEVFADWAREAGRHPRGQGIVVGGFCELDDGRLFNSAAVVDSSGVRIVYRKTHLWDREKLFFERGNEIPPVLDTPFGRVGVLICYDLEFPEMTRTLALHEADLIAVPTNWPLVDRPPGEHPPEVLIAMAAARTNRIFIACCDRTGPERGQEWTAGTAVIDESGWLLVTAEDGSAVADLDLARARTKKLTDLVDVLEDRRPELYGAVAERVPTPPSI